MSMPFPCEKSFKLTQTDTESNKRYEQSLIRPRNLHGRAIATLLADAENFF